MITYVDKRVCHAVPSKQRRTASCPYECATPCESTCCCLFVCLIVCLIVCLFVCLVVGGGERSAVGKQEFGRGRKGARSFQKYEVGLIYLILYGLRTSCGLPEEVTAWVAVQKAWNSSEIRSGS